MKNIFVISFSNVSKMKRLCLFYMLYLQALSQFTKSPCPDIFDYKSDGNETYGIINIKQSAPVTFLYILLKANFTIPVRLDSKDVGFVEAVDSKNLLENYNAGFIVSYRVYFPLTSPLPRLSALTVNGNLLCQGPEDLSSPFQDVTTFTLQHMSRLRNNDSIISSRFSDTDTSNISSSVNMDRAKNEPSVTQIYNKANFDTPKSPASFAFRLSSKVEDCGTVSSENDNHPFIYVGQSLLRGDMPWLVAIYRNTGTLKFICGGTLISNRHVVTAAHCMSTSSELIPMKEFVIKVGVFDLDDSADNMTVIRKLTAAHIHEAYNATTLANDLLVFTMDRSVEFGNYIRPMCLWRDNTELSFILGASGVVAGWDNHGDQNSIEQGLPKIMHFTILSTNKCKIDKNNSNYTSSDRTFCAANGSLLLDKVNLPHKWESFVVISTLDRSTGRDGVRVLICQRHRAYSFDNRDEDDPCAENSGGGLYLLEGGRWRLRGVISKSYRRSTNEICNHKEYVVFTDTAQYLSWIRDILRVDAFH